MAAIHGHRSPDSHARLQETGTYEVVFEEFKAVILLGHMVDG